MRHQRNYLSVVQFNRVVNEIAEIITRVTYNFIRKCSNRQRSAKQIFDLNNVPIEFDFKRYFSRKKRNEYERILSFTWSQFMGRGNRLNKPCLWQGITERTGRVISQYIVSLSIQLHLSGRGDSMIPPAPKPKEFSLRECIPKSWQRR